MMRAQQSFGAGLILTIGGVCKGCHHRPSCRPIIIITRNNSERSGIETLVIILITIVVVVLSLSLSIPLQWQGKKTIFLAYFFLPFGNINQVIDLPLSFISSFFLSFFLTRPGSQALPNCVCSPTERGAHTNIILLLFLTAFVIAENSQRVFFFFYFMKRAAPADNPRERTLERSIKSLNFSFSFSSSSCLRRS
jgi:flagellar basal body-associated protein FliL